LKVIPPVTVTSEWLFSFDPSSCARTFQHAAGDRIADPVGHHPLGDGILAERDAVAAVDHDPV